MTDERAEAIWKFEFEVTDTHKISMPQGSIILNVGSQRNGCICIWAVVDPSKPREIITLHIRGTGHPMGEAKPERYIGTAFDGPFVWHLFLDTGRRSR